MGKFCRDALRPGFSRKSKPEFQGTEIIGDVELFTHLGFDETLGLTSEIEPELHDIRTGKNTKHGLAALLIQSIYSRLTDYDVLRFFRGMPVLTFDMHIDFLKLKNVFMPAAKGAIKFRTIISNGVLERFFHI